MGRHPERGGETVPGSINSASLPPLEIANSQLPINLDIVETTEPQ
jgi:hypothetical protein